MSAPEIHSSRLPKLQSQANQRGLQQRQYRTRVLTAVTGGLTVVDEKSRRFFDSWACLAWRWRLSGGVGRDRQLPGGRE